MYIVEEQEGDKKRMRKKKLEKVWISTIYELSKLVNKKSIIVD